MMWNWKLIYPTTFSFLRQTVGDVTVAYPYKSYFAGTVAYLIKKSAARAFLKQLEQEKPFWLADDFLLFETQFQINNNVRSSACSHWKSTISE